MHSGARNREIDYEKAVENLKGLEADLEAARENESSLGTLWERSLLEGYRRNRWK